MGARKKNADDELSSVLFTRVSVRLRRRVEQVRAGRSRRLGIDLATSDVVRMLLVEAMEREPKEGA